jgi:hypothetical protein
LVARQNTLSQQALTNNEPEVLSSLLSYPELAAVVAAWPRLSAELRAGIVVMVKAAGR